MKILDFNQLRVSSEMTAYQVIKSRPLVEINSENEGKTLFRVVISRGKRICLTVLQVVDEFTHENVLSGWKKIITIKSGEVRNNIVMCKNTAKYFKCSSLGPYTCFVT